MKRIMLAVVAMVVVAGAVAILRAQDPVKVDSKHYKVEFENDQIRVLRIQYAPGEKSVMHEHPDSVAVFLNDHTAKFTYPDGKSEEAPTKAGTSKYIPAGSHLPENIGKTPLEVVLVELKKTAGK